MILLALSSLISQCSFPLEVLSFILELLKIKFIWHKSGQPFANHSKKDRTVQYWTRLFQIRPNYSWSNSVSELRSNHVQSEVPSTMGKIFKIRLCNIKSRETIWSWTLSLDISTTLRNLKKKNWNHTRPLESNRTISNQTTTFEISQSPQLDKIIQIPLNAAQLLWIIRKLSPLFSNLPCVATILWLINKLPGVVHDLIIVVGECPLSYWRTQLSYRRTPPSS